MHAQAKQPEYVISEMEVTNAEGYTKQYVPLANKALAESGQKRLAFGGRTESLAGHPPASRVVISVFENVEKAHAAYTSPAIWKLVRSVTNTAILQVRNSLWR